MYCYNEIVEHIQDSVNAGNITYEVACELNDIAYNKYLSSLGLTEFTEGEKTMAVAKPIAKGAGVAAGVAVNTIEKPMAAAGKGLINGAGKVADVVGKAVIKKPGENASVDVINDYNKKMNKFKAYFKTGAVVAVNIPLTLVPFTNMPLNASVYTALKKSNDPSDKEVMNLLNNLANTGKSFASKLTSFVHKKEGKLFTNDDMSELKRMYSEGLNIAKNAETKIKNALSKAKTTVTEKLTPNNNMVKESVNTIELIDLLFNESGILCDDPFDTINYYIENTEYDDETFELVNKFIKMV